MSPWLAGSGLVCGFVGALLIFRFGVPRYPERSRAGSSFLLLEEDDPAEVERVKWADWVSHAGALLLALGFVLQFVALLLDD